MGDEVLSRLDGPRRYAEEKRDSNRIGHFQPIHAAAPLTGRAESSKSDYLAPQIWLSRADSPEREPTGESRAKIPGESVLAGGNGWINHERRVNRVRTMLIQEC